MQCIRSSHRSATNSNNLEKSVTILQCYVACIYSAHDPGPFSIAEPSGSPRLDLRPCHAEIQAIAPVLLSLAQQGAYLLS